MICEIKSMTNFTKEDLDILSRDDLTKLCLLLQQGLKISDDTCNCLIRILKIKEENKAE